MNHKMKTTRRFFAMVLLTALLALVLVSPAAFGAKLEEADPDPDAQGAPPISEPVSPEQNPDATVPSSVDASWAPWSWLESGLRAVAEWAASTKEAR